MTVSFWESGENFGPFDEDKLWLPEKLACYRRIKQHGVKTVDFILLNSKGRVCFVKVKSWAPKSGNNFDCYFKVPQSLSKLWNVGGASAIVLNKELAQKYWFNSVSVVTP